MKSKTAHLAAIAEDADYIRQHATQTSSLVEPEIGARAARRFLAAVAAGDVSTDDAWSFVCGHLHCWNPNEDPRLCGFINQLAASAASPAKAAATEVA